MRPTLIYCLTLSVVVPLLSSDVGPKHPQTPRPDTIRVAYVDFASQEYSPVQSNNVERFADCHFALLNGSVDAVRLLTILDAATVPTRFVDANVRMKIQNLKGGPIFINSTGQVRWSAWGKSDTGLATEELNNLKQQMDALAREQKCGRYRPEHDLVPF